SWNGTTWTVAIAPNPGPTSTALTGVSCVATACKAVGSFATTAASRTVVLSWSGAAWSVNASPNSGAFRNTLRGVSCASTISFKAVGDYNTEEGFGSPTHALTETYG